MALEDKDLKQLAALLGDVLAPRIREAVAANVATRVDALAVRLQDEQKALLNIALAAMRDAIGAAVKEVRDEVQEISAAVGTLKYGTAQQLAEVEQRVAGRIDDSITELRELRSTASNLDGIITATQARMAEGLAEVKAAIPEVPPPPEIPAPTKLVEGGELSEPMRVAMDLAVRQVFAPALRAALTPLDEQLASHANLIETNARLAGAARVALEENVKTFYTETNKNISIVAHSVESVQEKAANEIDTLAKVVGAFEKDIAGIEKDIDGVESRLTEKLETVAATTVSSQAQIQGECLAKFAELNEQITVSAKSVETYVEATSKQFAEVAASIDAVETGLHAQLLDTGARVDVHETDVLAKLAELNEQTSNGAKHTEAVVNELAKVVAGVEQRRVELGAMVNECIKSQSELAESLVRVNVRAEAANERANAVHEELKSEVDTVANAVRDKFAEAEDIVKKVSTHLSDVRSTIVEVHDRVENVADRVEVVNADSKEATARLETHSVEARNTTLARFDWLDKTVQDIEQRLIGERFISVDASMQALRDELKELVAHEAQAEMGTTRAINDVQTALSAQARDIGARVDEVVLSVRTAQAAAMQHADSTVDAVRQELVVLETLQRQAAETDTEVHASLRAKIEVLTQNMDANVEFAGGVTTRLSAALQGLADEVKAFSGTTADDFKRHGDAVSALATSNINNATDLGAVKGRQAELLASLEASDKLLGELQQASKAMVDQQATLQGFIETVSKGLDVAGARIAEVDSAATVRARAAVQGAEQAVADAMRELTARIDDSVTALSGDINSNAQRADEADKVVQDFVLRRMDEALVPITKTHAGLATTVGAHDMRFNALETGVAGVKTALEGLESSVYTAAEVDATVAKFDAAHKVLHDEVGRLQTAHIEIEARAVSTAESKAVDAVAVLSDSLVAQAHKHAAEALDAAMPALKDVVRSFNTEYVPGLVQAHVDKQIEPLTVALAPHAEAAARQAASAVVDSYTAALHDQTAEVATRVAADACGEAVGAAKAAAEAIAAGALAQVEPLARSVAVDAVPAAVQQCTAELSANTAQIAEEVARGVAEVVSKVGAEAAAQAARTVASEVADDFVEDALAQVKASTAVMEAALFERVKDAVVPVVLEGMKLETVKATAEHATFLEQKLSVALIERVQREVDRIPRPRDGEDGKPGKDARVVTPVPYEADKFYEHGAWVTHKGGTWVAARGTKVEPAADTDWDCVAPGVASVDAALQDDGRTFVVRTALSDGTTSENQFKLPLLIQRDVYKDEREYDENDMVTYDGGQWIAKSSGKLPRPGTDKSWRLMVKAGRNGKDGVAAPARERFRGEWKLDTLYEEGEIVRHAGVGWFCNKQTRERPPFSTLTSNDTWTKMGS